MRPLNRPMFRYGGPIKEGIMNGMKEKQAINTVGSPLAPQDSSGRQGYALPLLAFAAPAAMTAARMLAPRAIMGGLRSLASGFRGAKYVGPTDKGLTGMQRLRNLFPTTKFLDAGSKIPLGGTGTTKGALVPYGAAVDATGKLGLRQALTSPSRIGAAIRENPGTAFLAAGQIKNTPEILGGAYDIGKGTLQGAANYLLGTNFGKDVPKETGSDVTLERTDKITTVPNEGTGAVETPKTEAEKAKINEDRINETREKYYKLMGIDKMNKKAAYNSLIDASKIVQEEGGDLKGSIRSGNLQNRIISAISKNLDSSADLKKQINAAILKGEIEKDIKQSDPANAVLNELRLLQGKKLKKDLEGSSVADMIAATSAKSGAGTVTSDIVTEFIRSKGTDALTLPDDKFQKWERNENNKGKDEIDYFQEKYSGLDDGIYVVNKRAVQKSGNQIAFVDLDEIIG